MPIQLNDGLFIAAPRSGDTRYGPYNNTSTAIAQVPKSFRYLGLTVLVGDKEYWWKAGVEDIDLVIKIPDLSTVATSGSYNDLSDKPTIIGGSGVTASIDAYGDITIDFDASELTSLTVDNLTLDGNTISSTNTDGNITLAPNGTGKVSINSLYSLPTAAGASGQVLTAGASGTTSFSTLPDATTSTKGIASFNSTYFSTSSGDVSIKVSGVPNDRLVNSSLTIGSTTTALGATSTSLTGLQSLDVDNLTLDGNTISSSTGDIILNPPTNSKVVVLDSDLILKNSPLTFGETRVFSILGERNATNTTPYAQIDLSNFDSNFDGGTEYIGASIKAFLPFLNAQGGGHLTFSTANGVTLSEAMRINHLGNIGIGTTSPTKKLEISGDFKIDNLNFDGNTISSTDTDGNIVLAPNGTGKVNINSLYSLPAATGTTGQVLTYNIDNTTSFQSLASVATSGSYNDLTDLPDAISIVGGSGITSITDAYGNINISFDASELSSLTIGNLTLSGNSISHPDDFGYIDIIGILRFNGSYSLPAYVETPNQVIITNEDYGVSFGYVSYNDITDKPFIPLDISELSDNYNVLSEAPDLSDVTTDIEITDSTKGVILRSPDNTRWRITVDNSGNLTTTALA